MHLPTSQSLSSNFMGSSFGQEEAYQNVYHALNQQQTFYPPSIQQQPTGFSQGTNYGLLQYNRSFRVHLARTSFVSRLSGFHRPAADTPRVCAEHP